MASARLNVFQRLVREWETLHPYNGIQVLSLAGEAPGAGAVAAACAAAFGRLGLGPVTVSGHEYAFDRPRAGPPAVVEGSNLCDVLSAELNRPFADGEVPLRPLLIKGSEGGGYHLGVTYRHWVADSVAVRRVLREVYAELFEPGLRCDASLSAAGPGYWRRFGPGGVGGAQRWGLIEGLLAAARQSSRMKRVCRVEGEGAGDFRAGFTLHPLPDGAIDRVRDYARRAGAKVNDVLLAALAEAVWAEGVVVRTSRRQDLALGTIVDLRPFARGDLQNTFDLFLGFTTAFIRPDHLRDFEGLVDTLARQHALARHTGAAQASQLRMAAGLVAHRAMPSREKVAEFYRKRVPVSAGISNVQLRGDWIAERTARIRDFVRVSPTGPMMPVVISATTLGSRFHFGLTRRASVVPADAASRIADRITTRLTNLE